MRRLGNSGVSMRDPSPWCTMRYGVPLRENTVVLLGAEGKLSRFGAELAGGSTYLNICSTSLQTRTHYTHLIHSSVLDRIHTPSVDAINYLIPAHSSYRTLLGVDPLVLWLLICT